MFVRRLHVDHLYLLLPHQLSKEMVAHVDVPRLRVGNDIVCQLNRSLIVLKTGMHGTPAPGSKKPHTCLGKQIFFVTSPNATYSASVVDKVTHFSSSVHNYYHP